MTKKHYIAIAKVIENETAGMEYNEPMAHAIKSIAIGLCNVFAEDNAYFDDSKFLKACGIVE